MINIEVDQKTVNSMLEKAINERVDEIVKQKYFLTYSELAEYLNISKPIIEDRLIKNGLKYYRVGSKYLFKIDEVDEFLDDMTASMTATNNDIKFFNKLKEGASYK
ncbi:helix-turn-helix domain-containing protein [Lentibacillus salicampi]|uniref:Helix-turn-helix domain-containing protein n=1 Tax=Lentibacillus salicampi TaxID=175306 RepID=A0A4Y9A8T5_9BACI|nr:helix-turn-helix domain-containing protein [Lentibacillus salicampi]TFJ91517.1 helix-turn-helix domain-containing protein [Lentibacillus salicampi]